MVFIYVIFSVMHLILSIELTSPKYPKLKVTTEIPAYIRYSMLNVVWKLKTDTTTAIG